MDEIKAVVSSYWTWLAICTGLVGGVWWWKMTSTTANFSLGISVVALAIAVFKQPWIAGQPIAVRLLWVGVLCAALSLVLYYTLWTAAPNATAVRIDPAAKSTAVAELSRLGWTVKPGTDDIQFEIASKPLPSMKESAIYFAQLQTPFRLHFQSVKSIDGLHELAAIKGCTKIEISAGEFSDISELQGFSSLTSLTISQTPINGLSVVDASPLASLTDLRDLNLNYTKIRTIDSLVGLTKLENVNLGSTLIRDLTPLAKLNALKSLEIRDTEVSDLTAISDIQSLSELVVSGKQVPGLVELSNLTGLKRLTIIEQAPVDLSPLSRLSNLDYLWLWMARFDLAPLRSLTNLHELALTGMELNTLTPVTQVDALGNLKEMKRLTLGYIDISDLAFVSNLTQLEEIGINRMPVTSIAPLRGLKSLKSVGLNMTNVTDITPLLDLPLLASLSVSRTPARADLLTELERRGVRIQR